LRRRATRILSDRASRRPGPSVGARSLHGCRDSAPRRPTRLASRSGSARRLRP
jgi:hypothetical protein